MSPIVRSCDQAPPDPEDEGEHRWLFEVVGGDRAEPSPSAPSSSPTALGTTGASRAELTD